jgi:hypothetical protein
MTCEEFLRILDERVDGTAPSAAWADHAAGCPACSMALRLERTLRDAPSWSEALRLSPDRRAAVLLKASSASYFWTRLLPTIEESALTALAAAGLAALVLNVAPKLWASAVPENIRGAIAPYTEPLLGAVRTFTAPFLPLLNETWGVALLGATAFTVLFAAVLSARTLAIRPAWMRST